MQGGFGPPTGGTQLRAVNQRGAGVREEEPFWIRELCSSRTSATMLRAMSRTSKILLSAAASAFVAAQFVPLEHSNPAVESDLSAPKSVKVVLKRSCYDCHSHETRWPWYAYVAPASFLVTHDVREARDEMNFSTWNRYRSDKRVELLDDVLEMVNDGEMPPWYYLVMHPGARLSDADRELIGAWATAPSH